MSKFYTLSQFAFCAIFIITQQAITQQAIAQMVPLTVHTINIGKKSLNGF